MKIYGVLKIYLPIFILIIIILYGAQKHFQKQKPSPLQIPKIAQIGPFGKNIEITEKINDLVIKLKAKHIYLKKSKIFIFKSTLYKKLIAQDIELVILRKGKKLLMLKKHKQTLYPSLNRIYIDHPQIIYPSTILPPEKIIIDKNKSKIVFNYKNKTIDFSKLIK